MKINRKGSLWRSSNVAKPGEVVMVEGHDQSLYLVVTVGHNDVRFMALGDGNRFSDEPNHALYHRTRLIDVIAEVEQGG